MSNGVYSSNDSDSFPAAISINGFGSGFTGCLPAAAINSIMDLMRRIQKNSRAVFPFCLPDYSDNALSEFFLYFLVWRSAGR